MAPEIKFCGLTRPADAERAVALGALYTGVIFAGGPRQVSERQAMEVLSVVPGPVVRVGVFADQSADEILRHADHLQLGAVQLHGTFDPARAAEIRREHEGLAIWPVCRVADAELPDTLAEMMALGDAVLLDALVPGALGGTGVAMPWEALASGLQRLRTRPLVLAGGLRPENVAEAVAALDPDVVDVSSGVETAPGIKDHDRMRAFRDAVQGAASA